MAKKSCKFGKVSRGRRKGQCRKSKKTPKKRKSAGYHLVTGGADNLSLNGRRGRRRR